MATQRYYRNAGRIIAVYDVDEDKAQSLARRLLPHPRVICCSELIENCQLILEAASAQAAAALLPQALRANREILVMSVGGLLLNTKWRSLLKSTRGRVYLPSGALAGLDGVKAMGIGKLRRIVLTTRKPPQALLGAPFLKRRHLTLSNLKGPKVLFEGSPKQVVKAFPQNTNVAAVLALASGSQGIAKAHIRVVADPTIKRNTHEIDVEGDCGRIRATIESQPSRNPKTSELAIRSAIATLDRIFGKISIGT